MSVTSIDDRARNAFFFHYVSGFAKTYDVLKSLYDQSSTDKTLIASVDAVSLAFFSFQFDCVQASHVSRKRYLSALPLVNKALSAPESAASDSTLLAVLLLDLYEKISNNNPRSISSWMSHINGALALVALRKEPLLQDYTGLRLSARLSTNLLISCVSANSPVPPALIKLRSDLEPFLNKEDPKWRISGLVVKYANLKGAVQDGCLCVSDIVTRASDLDSEFEILVKQMPPSWHYSTVYPEEASERVFGQRYDTYQDHFITQSWNVVRVMRILLNDILRKSDVMLDRSSLDKASSYPRLPLATSSIDDLAKEICATAPQFTAYEKTKPRSQLYSTTQKLQSYSLLFPLYAAGVYASSTTRIKPWIIKQLRFMSHEMGIRNAGTVADVLEMDEGTCIWDMYSMLGSYAFAA